MQAGFGSGSLWGVVTQFLDGSTPLTPTIVKVGTLQEWALDISWDTKQLYGGFDSPVAIGRGKAKYPLKFKFAQLNANLLQSFVFGTPGQPAAGETLMAEDEQHTVPGSTPYSITISPPNSGTFVADWGVRYASSGLTLTKVASAPTGGQYSVSAGVYSFASTDANAGVLISYEYTLTSGYTIQVSRQLLGSLPTFKFFGKVMFSGKQMTVKMNQVVASKLSMQTKLDDFMIPEIDAEAFADASGTVMYLSMVEL
jgi:hypothetical protein